MQTGYVEVDLGFLLTVSWINQLILRAVYEWVEFQHIKFSIILQWTNILH